MPKTRHLEKIVRGFSNHRRIEILQLLERRPELSLFEIAEALNINFKTASEHTRRLAIAGIVLKRNEGASVRHAISPLGRLILKFLRTLE
jgi:DNA-binding transcriptional ArsR family regulator